MPQESLGTASSQVAAWKLGADVTLFPLKTEAQRTGSYSVGAFRSVSRKLESAGQCWMLLSALSEGVKGILPLKWEFEPYEIVSVRLF